MYIIKSPVKGYSGFGYGIHFQNGEAKTDSEHIAGILRNKGYEVVAEEAPIDTDMDALREEAKALGIVFHPNIGKEKLEAKITEAKAQIASPSVEITKTEE